MPRTALYTGTFDPVTNGHLDVVRRAAAIADKVVVAAGIHSSKAPIFTVEERLEMLREVCGPAVAQAGAELEVATFSGLAIEAARQHGATLIVRGLRDGTDLDYEMQMGAMNETMAPDVQTVFVPASPAVRPITATLVRQVAQMGGDVSAFVPPSVAERIRAKFQRGR
jgi:pantetheine-phosphate adenylyltransferase